jgi:apolipoprotein N-acyltransferase
LYAAVVWPWTLLGWVGLVPWLVALERLHSVRAALAAGLLMSVAFALALFGWFAEAIETYTGAPWAAALVVLLILSPILQPQFVVFALVRYVSHRAGAGFWRTTFAGASLYVATEGMAPKLLGDTLGQGLYASPLMRQAADIAGAHGLTFVMIVVNECLLAGLRRAMSENEGRERLRTALPPIACAVVLWVGLLLYGGVRQRQFGSGNAINPIRVGMVQADISHYGRLAEELGTYDAVRMILDAYFDLSTRALQQDNLDLLVWPETVYPTTFGTPKSEDGAAFDREIAAFVGQAGVPLIFGSYDVEQGREFNAAFFLEPPEGGRMSFEAYRKVGLFPLTEQVPSWLDHEIVRRALPWLGTWTPGPGPQAVSVSLANGRSIGVAPLICYEDVDPNHAINSVRQGASVIVTLSNDSWFSVGPAPYRHLVVSAFRSIETRRPQIRVTNTGVSAAISDTGELLGTIGVHERDILVVSVAPVDGAWTLMLAWGDWFPRAALMLGSVLIVSLVRWHRHHR